MIIVLFFVDKFIFFFVISQIMAYFASVFSMRLNKTEEKMKLVHTINSLRAELETQRKAGKKIGLVPTMGALHEGHASLVRRAVAENDIVVVSDFVNPTQFNDKNDLLKYPRTLEADCELLKKVGAAYVFAPSVEEIYPEPDTFQWGVSDSEQAVHDYRTGPCLFR